MGVLLRVISVKGENKFTHSKLCAKCLPHCCGPWRCCRHSNWLWIVKLVHSIGMESGKVWSRVCSLKPLLFRRFKRQAVSIWREVLCHEPYLGEFLVEGGRVLTVWGGAGLWSKSGREWTKIWEPWGKKGVWGRSSEDLGHLCMHRKPRIIP